MEPKEVKALYQKFLEGECSESEFLLLKQYFPTIIDVDELFDEEAFNNRRPEEIILDSRRSEKIFERILAMERPRASRIRKLWIKYSSVAAILLFIGLSFYFYQSTPSKRSFLNKTSSTKRIQLSDNSSVYLRPGARLDVDEKMWRDSARVVTLTGEAFFAVHKDPKRPFIVNSGNGLQVRVLGTRFYSNFDEQEQSVVLTEGSVKLQASTHELIMEPEDMVVYNRLQGSITKHKVDTLYFNSWINNLAYFRDQSIVKVINRLNDIYPERHISIAAPFHKLNFTGYLPMDNLEEAIQILERTFANHKLIIFKQE